ncbi:hypothetical protein [Rhodococcus sp. H29-C3]|uniref:hypothetical protein n=1 Tax=Rhodococcus sp. H29-C3 TaxID=3046307 RepID=UPI0024B9F81D|nr:hypothetical protein [Rhodococcus sp. H29-C3]MDJ0359910.1 hypothetical protein [Rhodococcus sp. H29-C3]
MATSVIAVTVLVLAVLPSIPRPKFQVRIDAFSHPRNTTIVAIYFGVLVSVAVTALVLSPRPGAIALTALAAFAWTVGIGTFLDKRLERALRDGR